QVSGPLGRARTGDTVSRRRIFSCYPAQASEEDPCAARLLRTLAQRAYRRPGTETDLASLRGFYLEGRKKGSFEAGIELALRAMLVDPDFLFRSVRSSPSAPAGTVAPVTDVELASRLSFFLWSSIPDD